MVGLIMVALAFAIPVAFWLLPPTSLVYLEMHRIPRFAWAIGVAFVVGSIPLLVPQRTPPTDPRRKRGFIAFSLWGITLQLCCLGFDHPEIDTIAMFADGDVERRVVVYRPDTPDACLAIWADQGLVTRLAGVIGAPGEYREATFLGRDTVVLKGFTGDWDRTIRLAPRSGRPLDHTGPCDTDPQVA